MDANENKPYWFIHPTFTFIQWIIINHSFNKTNQLIYQSDATGRGMGLERYWSVGELYWQQPETEDAAPKIGQVSEAVGRYGVSTWS